MDESWYSTAMAPLGGRPGFPQGQRQPSSRRQGPRADDAGVVHARGLQWRSRTAMTQTARQCWLPCPRSRPSGRRAFAGESAPVPGRLWLPAGWRAGEQDAKRTMSRTKVLPHTSSYADSPIPRRIAESHGEGCRLTVPSPASASHSWPACGLNHLLWGRGYANYLVPRTMKGATVLARPLPGVSLTGWLTRQAVGDPRSSSARGAGRGCARRAPSVRRDYRDSSRHRARTSYLERTAPADRSRGFNAVRLPSCCLWGRLPASPSSAASISRTARAELGGRDFGSRCDGGLCNPGVRGREAELCATTGTTPHTARTSRCHRDALRPLWRASPASRWRTATAGQRGLCSQ